MKSVKKLWLPALFFTLTLLSSANAIDNELINDLIDAFDIKQTIDDFMNRKNKPIGNKTCVEGLEDHIFQIPNGIFFLMQQGLYLGQWGDYESCIDPMTDGQYVQVMINGKYNGPSMGYFPRGGAGKYQPFSTALGLCLPKECGRKDLVAFDNYFASMAKNVNWTDVNVTYRFSSTEDREFPAGTRAGAIILFVVFCLFALLGITAMILEATKYGDQPGIDYKRFDQVAKFKNVVDYQPVLLQRKKSWAKIFVGLSPNRNMLRMAMEPASMDIIRNKFGYPSKYLDSLKVFNGLKALGVFYVIYGHCYYFSWFGYLENPDYIQKMKQSIAFTVIPGAFFMAPMILFVSGFLQTFSFVHQYESQKDETSYLKFTLQFWGRKIARFMPYNIFILFFMMFWVPFIGEGPIWTNYNHAIEQCNDYWWTSVLFINNFYPENIDEKCMPWTWWLSAFMQLTLTLPILLAIFFYLSKKLSTFLYALLLFISFTISMGMIQTEKIGASPALNDKFYAHIFMKPYYHFNSYLLGIVLSLCYITFLKESVSNESNSFASRIMNAIKANGSIRYPLYFIGLTLMVLPVVGVHAYIAHPDSAWSLTTQTLYGTFAYFIFSLGTAALILPAILGKADLLRFFLGGDIWNIMGGHYCYNLYLFHPAVAIYFYMAISTPTHLDYHMMFYNFLGTFVFTWVFGTLPYLFVDRSVYGMLNIKHDIRMSAQCKDFNIDDYMIGVLLGGEDKSKLLASVRQSNIISDEQNEIDAIRKFKENGSDLQSFMGGQDQSAQININRSTAFRSTIGGPIRQTEFRFTENKNVEIFEESKYQSQLE